MYEVDSHDTVVELTDAPQPDVGAPLPQILVTEHCLILAYALREPDPTWDGTHVKVVSPETDELTIAIVDFYRPSAHMFGPPDDETFEGHPLTSQGLHPYGVFEIQDSSWIRNLERMNSVHPSHDKQRFMARRRHFIFAFHDSTFECVSEGFVHSILRSSMRMAFDRMLELSVSRSG